MTSRNASAVVIRWHGATDAVALRQAACQRILAAAVRAIQQRGQFLIVLAGGNTPRAIYPLLRYADTDWSRWQVYFCDERCLPANAIERNSRMAAETWLDQVAIPQHHVHIIPAELGANAAAHAYAETLRSVGDFDLTLLGLGEDGHTASLFPNHDWGAMANAPDTLAVFDAPKPPGQRVSLSAARLSRSREVLFIIEGETKRSVVRRWRDSAPLPACAIQPASGVDILIDAALLNP